MWSLSRFSVRWQQQFFHRRRSKLELLAKQSSLRDYFHLLLHDGRPYLLLWCLYKYKQQHQFTCSGGLLSWWYVYFVFHQKCVHFVKISLFSHHLQPENILLQRKGSLDIKIADFGLAIQLSPGQQVRNLVGTAEYVGQYLFLCILPLSCLSLCCYQQCVHVTLCVNCAG